MSLLYDVVKKIATLSTAFTAAGTSASTTGNVFASRLPHTPATAIVVLQSPGGPPQHSFTGGVPFEQPRVQVIVRSTSYATAESYAQTIWDGLDGIANSTTVSSSGPRYVEISALQSPFDLGRDDNEWARIACNYQVKKER